ncbi:hypothetical protein VP01_3482g1 [Puccinia sorghi]|uniref:Uncharacterized protein n=1 Tax=Puccinia sorghi TaxID=27349 RepID=A0A0L6UWQ6_9BASI|nr:hypothetical protein VP01_3482g1 [Puccinia sorghi]
MFVYSCGYFSLSLNSSQLRDFFGLAHRALTLYSIDLDKTLFSGLISLFSSCISVFCLSKLFNAILEISFGKDIEEFSTKIIGGPAKRNLNQLPTVDMQKFFNQYLMHSDFSKTSAYAKRWSLDDSLAGACCLSTEDCLSLAFLSNLYTTVCSALFNLLLLDRLRLLQLYLNFPSQSIPHLILSVLAAQLSNTVLCLTSSSLETERNNFSVVCWLKNILIISFSLFLFIHFFIIFPFCQVVCSVFVYFLYPSSLHIISVDPCFVLSRVFSFQKLNQFLWEELERRQKIIKQVTECYNCLIKRHKAPSYPNSKKLNSFTIRFWFTPPQKGRQFVKSAMLPMEKAIACSFMDVTTATYNHCPPLGVLLVYHALGSIIAQPDLMVSSSTLLIQPLVPEKRAAQSLFWLNWMALEIMKIISTLNFFKLDLCMYISEEINATSLSLNVFLHEVYISTLMNVSELETAGLSKRLQLVFFFITRNINKSSQFFGYYSPPFYTHVQSFSCHNANDKLLLATRAPQYATKKPEPDPKNIHSSCRMRKMDEKPMESSGENFWTYGKWRAHLMPGKVFL